MAKVKSKGCTLKLGATAIGQVISISGPNTSVETVDVTELGDAYRTFLGTVIDNGEISCVVHYDPDLASQTSVFDLLEDQVTSGETANLTPSTWVLTFTDATPATYTFSGVLTGHNIESIEIGGVVTATFTIKLSGAITKA